MATTIDHGPQAGRGRQNAEQTYRDLRFGLFLLLGLLGVGILWQSAGDDGVLCGSISAYYYTPVGPILVGMLCAIGTALVVYRGAIAVENTALDVAGFLAMVVAFVPTGRPVQLAGTDAVAGMTPGSCTQINVPSEAVIAGATGAAVPALILTGGAALAAAAWAGRGGRASRLPAGVAATALALALGCYLFARAAFDAWAHATAAFLLFACMIVVVAVNAHDARAKRAPRFALAYRLLAVGMVVGCIGFLVLTVTGVVPGGVLWAEAVGIAGFGAFWLLQTVELRRRVVRG